MLVASHFTRSRKLSWCMLNLQQRDSFRNFLTPSCVSGSIDREEPLRIVSAGSNTAHDITLYARTKKNHDV
jgi:hypothetical protein